MRSAQLFVIGEVAEPTSCTARSDRNENQSEECSDMISKTRRTIPALAVLLCATAASAQENRGTPEQRTACAPDAFRFCLGYIPDPTSVEQCLRQNRSDLGDACRAVFEQSADALASKSSQGRKPERPIRPAISRDAE